MKYNNVFLWSNISAILLVLSMAFLFFNGLVQSLALFFVGAVIGLIIFLNIKKISNSDLFFVFSTVVGVFIVLYSLIVEIKSNLALLGLMLFMLCFFFSLSRERPVLASKKLKVTPYVVDGDSAINVEAQKIYDDLENIKKELKVMHEVETPQQESKKFYFKEGGKSFHLAGCISLARTPKSEIKSSKSRTELLANGLKSCKICNS